jgi:hypothetical protein
MHRNIQILRPIRVTAVPSRTSLRTLQAFKRHSADLDRARSQSDALKGSAVAQQTVPDSREIDGRFLQHHKSQRCAASRAPCGAPHTERVRSHWRLWHKAREVYTAKRVYLRQCLLFSLFNDKSNFGQRVD